MVFDGVHDKKTSEQIKGFDNFYYERKLNNFPSNKKRTKDGFVTNITKLDYFLKKNINISKGDFANNFVEDFETKDLEKFLDLEYENLKKDFARTSVKRTGKRSKTMNPEELDPNENKIRSKSGKQILEAIENLNKSEEFFSSLSPQGKQR